jgi:hypothetical protein
MTKNKIELEAVSQSLTQQQDRLRAEPPAQRHNTASGSASISLVCGFDAAGGDRRLQQDRQVGATRSLWVLDVLFAGIAARDVREAGA